MARKEILDRIQKYVHPFRITKGKGFRLKDFDPGDTCGLKLDKGEAAELLARGTEWLAEEQDMLYAQDRWSLLLVFQAMDAAGKDGTIKHVMSGVNPQGCQVFSFKQPSREDLDHDFLWRYAKCLPERGRIGIFNRSYYEEVLVVRVHPEILKRQRLPPRSVGKSIWDERLADIAHFEDYLTRQGTIILKFFLNVSRKEQKKRFMERLDRPREALEVLGRRRARARLLGRLHARLRGSDPRHGVESRAVVRGAGRQQMVYPARRRRGDRGGGGEARAELPEDRRGKEEGAGGGTCGACPREITRSILGSVTNGRSAADRAFPIVESKTERRRLVKLRAQTRSGLLAGRWG